MDSTAAQPIPFKAETRQLLDILIHSLYTDREIFLRELISNAADALTRLDFETLTKREIYQPELEPAIRILPNEAEHTLTITDTGIGMTADEMVENLGTIAHSGARNFMSAMKQAGKSASEIIGQFGVGFYSAFMVAKWIRVVSRSFQPEAQAAEWFSQGDDTYTIRPTERAERGTSVVIKLKEDAYEFLKPERLREVIHKHSDFIPYPITIGEDKEQSNKRTALWRQNPRQVEKKDYDEFFRELTLEFEQPLAYAHMVVDAPVQMYGLLFIPPSFERGIFSLRKQEGLKLYAHKVLIQEYCKDLTPDYLNFVQGVVDSEDLPLNVSRESVQANRIMVNLKKLVTSKILDTLKKLAQEDAQAYAKFWVEFGRFIKQGVAVEPNDQEELYPLLRFHTTDEMEKWSSMDDYLGRMKSDQKDIYYIMGDDDHSALLSPHLDLVRQYGYEALVLTDPMDAFMLTRLNQYKEHALVNAANANLEPKKEAERAEGKAPELSEADSTSLVDRFKQQLGERVSDVRMTDRLSGSPARLSDPQGAPNQEMQRVYRMLRKEFTPPKKVLELNPHHPILVGLSSLPADHPLGALLIEQVYEDALLVEGLHPDPVSMVPRIQKLLEALVQKRP